MVHALNGTLTCYIGWMSAFYGVSMSSSPRYLIIPERGRKDIETLLSLSSEALQTIVTILGSQVTLKTEEPSYQLIAREASITHEEAVAVLDATMNLTIQRKRYRLSDEQLLEDLKVLCPEKVKDLDTETQQSLL